MSKGFVLKGRISHLTDEDMKKAGQYSYDNQKQVNRILYIDDTLYTLSNGMIKANEMSNLKDLNSVQFQKDKEENSVRNYIME
jgi:hypothetical protein